MKDEDEQLLFEGTNERVVWNALRNILVKVTSVM
jgi:hypothetical protein